jgi:hypothetical protein
MLLKPPSHPLIARDAPCQERIGIMTRRNTEYFPIILVMDLYWASVEFFWQPRRISATNPMWHTSFVTLGISNANFEVGSHANIRMLFLLGC